LKSTFEIRKKTKTGGSFYLVSLVIFGLMTTGLNWNWIKFSLSLVRAIGLLHLQH